MTPPDPLGLGIVGLGYAGLAMARAAVSHPGVELRAVADHSTELRGRVAADFGVGSAAGIEELLDHSGVEAVYIATPTRWHHDHAVMAAAAGRHVVLEKPMATNVTAAEDICAAFERSATTLVVGYSQSFAAPIRSLAEAAGSGRFGTLRAINTWCYTDWMRRPRKPEDLDASLGGGVTFRQGAHQFDIIRLVARRAACRVRATGIRIAEGSVAGGSALAAYSALVDFDGGLYATAVYSGLGHFDSRVLTFGVGEAGERLPPGSTGYRRLVPATGAPAAPMFGVTVATFDEADVVVGPEGLLVERGDDTEELPYPPGPSLWDAVLDEFVGAVRDGRPARHDGRWGLATLEVCAAVETAAATGQDVWLSQQSAV